MTEIVARSIDPSEIRPLPAAAQPGLHKRPANGRHMHHTFAHQRVLAVDRILPFILAEKIKADLSLSDTQMGLLTGLAFAVCYALLSLPLARAADRGSPRLVLVSCVLIWSVMTTLGGLPPVSCSWPSHASVSHSERQAQYRRSCSHRPQNCAGAARSCHRSFRNGHPPGHDVDLRQAARLQMYSAGASF